MKLAADNPVGQIAPPPAISQFGGVEGGALGTLLNLLLNVLIVIAGVYALFNFVFAGYAFMSAGTDPKKIEGAWGKIWQTAIGLLVAVGSFVLAAIFGKLLFGDYTALTNPVIPN